jgi:uncharacterized protein (TIGR03000 family)
MTLKKNLLAALVAVAAVTMSANTSFAWFGHHGSCGSWGGGSWGGGSWGSHGGSWGGSWGGGSCGSYGGYSYGSGGSYGGYSSCGSYGGGYGYSGVVYDGYAVSRPVSRVYVAAVTESAVKTRLTMHVPADAKVILAGVETKQTGEVRQFATSRLSKGQSWKDYQVVVETTRDGQTLREERMLNLTGGEDQDLTVAFAEGDSTQQIAQR